MKIATHSDDSKMIELILHVATQCAEDSRFGAVKLNKILFYADFLSYLKRGKSITSQVYFAIKEGPAPQQMLPITEKMQAEGIFAFQSIDVGLPHPKKKPIALRPPNYKKLEAEDIAITNEVIEKFQSKNGTELSELSHKFAGYIAAFAQGPSTIIPYSMVQFDTKQFWGIEMPPLPEKLIDYGKELARKLANTSPPAYA